MKATPGTEGSFAANTPCLALVGVDSLRSSYFATGFGRSRSINAGAELDGAAPEDGAVAGNGSDISPEVYAKTTRDAGDGAQGSDGGL
jgi:hypothetical protein